MSLKTGFFQRYALKNLSMDSSNRHVCVTESLDGSMSHITADSKVLVYFLISCSVPFVDFEKSLTFHSAGTRREGGALGLSQNYNTANH